MNKGKLEMARPFDSTRVSLGLRILFWSVILWMVVPFSIGFIELGLKINLPMGGYARVRLQQLIPWAFLVSAWLSLWASCSWPGDTTTAKVSRIGALVATTAYVALETLEIISPDLAGQNMKAVTPLLFDLIIVLAAMYFSELSKDVDSLTCSRSWAVFYRSYFGVALVFWAMSVFIEKRIFNSIPSELLGSFFTIESTAYLSLWVWWLKLLRDLRKRFV